MGSSFLWGGILIMNDREMLLMEQLICFDIDMEDDEFRIIDELMIRGQMNLE